MRRTRFRLGRTELVDVMKRGKRAQSTLFSYVHLPAPEGYSRAGVVVSKKVATTAVMRNRMRRQTYEVLRTMLPDVHPAILLVCIAKKEARGMTHAALKQALEELFLKKKVY
jgi:ribonuclease P protein component